MAHNWQPEGEDRFTTLWTGLDDPRVKEYAIKKQNPNTGGGDPTGTTLDSSSLPNHLGGLMTSNGAIDILTIPLAQVNLASDEEKRTAAATDTERSTGRGYVPLDHENWVDAWATATRGAKLRSCRSQIVFLDVHVGIVTKDLAAWLRRLLNEEDERRTDRWLEISRRLREVLKELEGLVVQEGGVEWDWREGTRKQLVLRGRWLDFGYDEEVHEIHVCLSKYSPIRANEEA